MQGTDRTDFTTYLLHTHWSINIILGSDYVKPSTLTLLVHFILIFTCTCWRLSCLYVCIECSAGLVRQCTSWQADTRPALSSIGSCLHNHISFTLNSDPLKREEHITPRSRQECIIRFKIRQPVFLFVLDFLTSFIQENLTPFT